MASAVGRVTGIYIYPVKSCRGISVESAELTDRGFTRDRRWAVVEPSGRCLTQRELPALCRVLTTLENSSIRLEAAGHPSLELPLELDSGPAHPVQVWSYSGTALRSDPGSAWISRVLGRDCGLVFMPEEEHRQIAPRYAPPGSLVSYADAFPFLIIGEASLADLNARLPRPITMTRFRPNIVVGGLAAYAEDEFRRVKIGDVGFRGPKRCDRCVVTTIDPETGVKETEPLRTLGTYRRFDNAVWFGMNLLHENRGTLKLGDPVSRLDDQVE